MKSEVIRSDTIKLDALPYPSQPMIPISEQKSDTLIIDSEFYQTEALYPEQSGKLLGTGIKNGWKMAVVDIYPVQYIPAESIMIFNEEINYTLEFDNSGEQRVYTENIVNSSKREVLNLIDNTESINLYQPVSKELTGGIDYSIIIPEQWVKYVKPLIQWKYKKGLRCSVITVEHIHNTVGNNVLDQEEKMRVYIDWMRDSGCRYFFIIGQADGDIEYTDDGAVSPYSENIGWFTDRRDVEYNYYDYVDNYSDEHIIAADMYYSNLDGTWDDDRDGVYGEESDDHNEMDPFSDVYVGRLLAEDSMDVIHYIQNVLDYEKNYPTNIAKEMIVVSEDEYVNYTNMLMQDYINPSYNLNKYFTYEGNYSKVDIIENMENGAGLITFFTHGWINKFVSNPNGITISDFANLYNDTTSHYSIFVSPACWTAAYDYDCLAEHLMHEIAGGRGAVIATLMNYRYGWSNPMANGLSGSFYQTGKFIEYLTNYNSNKKISLGEIYHYIKDNYAGYHINYAWNLFGDPELPIYNDGPFVFNVEHNEMMGFGYSNLDISVTDNNGDPVDSAFVCGFIVNDSTGDTLNYKRGYTDIDGNYKYIFSRLANQSTIYITVTGQNYLPYEGECKVRNRPVYAYYYNNEPVFENDSLIVKVYKFPDYGIEPDAIKPGIENAQVILTNKDNIYREAFTDQYGIAKFPSYIDNTKDIKVYINSTYNIYYPEWDFSDYKGDIKPYLWSNINTALGKNNQNNLIRLINSDIIYMAYSDGDSIIVGKGSMNSKDIWELQKIGRGYNPALSEIDNGVFITWSYHTSVKYGTVHSPFSGVDSLSDPQVICYSEPVIQGNPNNDHILGSVISYRTLYSDVGDLLYYDFSSDMSSITVDTLIPASGDPENPWLFASASPIASYYISEGAIYPLVGFLDTSGYYQSKMMDKESKFTLFSINNELSGNINAGVYGNKTTLLWEKEIIPSVTELWKRDIIEGALQAPEKISPDNWENMIYPDVYEGNVYSGIDRRSSADIVCIWNEDSLIWQYSSPYRKYNPKLNIMQKETHLGWMHYYKCIFTEEAPDTNTEPYVIKTDIRVITSMEDDPIYDSPLFKAIPTDTQTISESVLYDYINGNPPAERLSYTAPGLNPKKRYEIEITVSENSPRRPQIIAVDNEVLDVIYGSPQKDIVKTYTVPQGVYSDRVITASIDRLKGNPNREANIRIFEYEVFEEETQTSGSSYYAFNTVNKIDNMQYDYSLRVNFLSGSKVIYYTVPSSEHVSITLFDITGRQVKQVYSGYAKQGKNTLHIEDKLSSGIYFVRMAAGEKTLTRKLFHMR